MDALPPPPPAAYVVYECKRWSWSSDRQHVWCLVWKEKK